MREIKFRAWDTTFKRYYYDVIVGSTVVIAEYINDTENNNLDLEYYTCSNDKSSEPFIVQQYTGLNDKHNNPIYEGDILSYEDKSKQRDAIHPYNVVKFNNGAFVGEGYNGSILVSPKLGDRTNWEIIGNIYSNPELLSIQ